MIKYIYLRTSRCVILSLVMLALFLSVPTINTTAYASSTFAGIYPSLTYSGAESYQQQVNQGKQIWLLDPRQTSLHLAEQLLSWPSSATTTLQSGGGIHDSSATVFVYSSTVDRGAITVTLARLDGNTNGGIWIVTEVNSLRSPISITTPQPYAILPDSSSNVGGRTPYTVTGTGSGFEGIIGMVYLYNSSYEAIAISQANGSTSFSTPLIYSTGSKGDALVALYTYGSADGGINGALLVKVTIS